MRRKWKRNAPPTGTANARRLTLALLVTLVVLILVSSALLVVGCGQGDGGQDDGQDPEATPSSAAASSGGGSPSPETSATTPDPEASLDARLRAELEEMSLETKVGQLFMIGFVGTAATSEVGQLIDAVRPGGIILFGPNIEDAGQLKELTSGLQELATPPTGQRLFVAVDQEGGQIVRVTWLGDDVAEADVKSAEQAYSIGRERGRALTELGINLNLAPVLDSGVAGDFLTKYDRCFPGGPKRIGELGKAMIAGQKDGGVMSTAKHFPGYGDIVDDPETVRLAVESKLPEHAQFTIAAEAEPEFVMSVVDVIFTPIDEELAFSMTPKGIDLLRKSVPGDYLVISDALDTETMIDRYGLEKVVLSTFKAGVDVLLVVQPAHSQQAAKAIVKAVRSGEIDEAELDRRVLGILRAKAAYFGQ